MRWKEFKVVEWWNGGTVERWSGGAVEWWSGYNYYGVSTTLVLEFTGKAQCYLRPENPHAMPPCRSATIRYILLVVDGCRHNYLINAQSGYRN